MQIFRNLWKSYSATFGKFIPQLLEIGDYYNKYKRTPSVY